MAVIKFVANGQPLEFDPDHVMFAEAAAFRRVTGEPFVQFAALLQAGREDVVQAILWIAAKRQNPELRFSDLEGWDFVNDFAAFITAANDVTEDTDADAPEGDAVDPTSPVEPEEATTSSSSD